MSIESEAIRLLMADPKEFFQHYMVSIAGYPNRAAGPARFKMFLNPGSDPAVRWRIGPAGNPDPGDGACAHDELIAFYVPMITVGAAYSHATLPADGLDFMVTSQLTNCSFGHFTGPGGTMVTHLQPGPSRSSADNDALIRRHMGAGAQIMTQNSTYVGGRDLVTVVGKRVGGTWTFYSQNARRSGAVRELVMPITSF